MLDTHFRIFTVLEHMNTPGTYVLSALMSSVWAPGVG